MAASFEILPGLPGTGRYPEQFSTHGGTHREGFVVRVRPADGEPWVGNFQPAYTSFLSAVLPHPDADALIVVSGGIAYVVDPATRRLLDGFGGAIRGAARDDRRLAFATDTEVILLEAGARWVSPRLAWDGIEELALVGDRLTAVGLDASDDTWRPIELDLRDRRVLQTAYELRLAPVPRSRVARIRDAIARFLSSRRSRGR